MSENEALFSIPNWSLGYRDKNSIIMIITSKILSSHPELTHGISTRFADEPPFYNNLSKHVGDNPETISKNRARFFGSLGIAEASLVHANQIHSDGVSIVTKPGLYPNTDALITSQKGLNLVISVADCMPVMIYDESNHVIANIHSGWRGTQKNIAGKTISIMKTDFHSKPAELIIFMGPAISKPNFEVDKDVADMFPAEYVSPKPNSEGKFIVDTGRMVYESLLAAGVPAKNIEQFPGCTYDTPNLHSYRRDKSGSGRMFAVLGMKE
ncbi:MAG TPA: peptidoglycan editing factor PgeF [Ignavibacteria bacterium]|nr:peptidoglycan editing factor PgeF [Ignavibacteria bacterium]HMQ99517.1 peptidoglycan editing factor PgeF [Ignavibacteria bacterium]